MIDAPPWIVSVDVPLIAAASSSDSIDFAVPGSPTSISPRPVASVTSMRSMLAIGATTFGAMPSERSPAHQLFTRFVTLTVPMPVAKFQPTPAPKAFR